MASDPMISFKPDMSESEAGYTAIQSRTVGQEQYCENRSEFRNVTDRLGKFESRVSATKNVGFFIKFSL